MSIKTFIKRIFGKTTPVRLPPNKMPKLINSVDLERCLYCDSKPDYCTSPLHGYPPTKHTIRCRGGGKFCHSITIDFPAVLPNMVNATVLAWNLLNSKTKED
jgi:hypothetical protein